MWKIVFSDIDGTLLNKERQVSKKTLAAYDSIRDKADLVLISSRMPNGMTYTHKQFGVENMPLVCYNGGLVLRDGMNDFMDEGNILLDISIPWKTVAEVSDILKDFEANYSVYSYNNWYTTKDDYWTKREENNTQVKAKIVSPDFFRKNKTNAHKIMLMGRKEEMDTLYKNLEENYSELALYRSKDTYIEISHINTSKGLGVNHLLLIHFDEIEVEDTIAFGDNYNDIPLFEAVGYGMAVANAKDELKEVADFVSSFTNKENAVAEFISDNLGYF
ncbi:MAG: HAD family hydrolase [Saprospiraceae bacterium]